MTKQLKCYYLLLIRYYKLSLLNQFLEGYSIMAAWGNNFFKNIFFLLSFHFSAPLKCHWPIRASSLKSHSPAGRIYSPLATGRVLMKRLQFYSLKVNLRREINWHLLPRGNKGKVTGIVPVQAVLRCEAVECRVPVIFNRCIWCLICFRWVGVGRFGKIPVTYIYVNEWTWRLILHPTLLFCQHLFSETSVLSNAAIK